MCGIVGYYGNKSALPILIKGLKALEYRGYDSAGISIMKNNEIKTYKEKGRVKNLEEKLDYNNLSASLGIAHTRWATHGEPSSKNAHPHLNNKETIAVVHNGIIENYLTIKEDLIKKGYTFKSETDTEVIPNLIDYYYELNNNFELSFYEAIKNLKGSFAILCLSTYFDGLLVAKNASPLVIGENKNEFYIASDIPAILDYTKNFYFLEDLEFAKITNKTITFYDYDYHQINKNPNFIKYDNNNSLKDGYNNYMLKEIYEQPNAIKETLTNCLNEFNLTKDEIKNVNKIYIIACGTAYHAGLTGKIALEEFTNITTIVEVASEFRYFNPLIDEHTLCIFISQSGETADTIAALKLAKKHKAITICITNTFSSSITRYAKYTIYTYAGLEIAVASTKAYVSQVIALINLTIYISKLLGKNKKDIELLEQELLTIPLKITNILGNTKPYENIAKKLKSKKNIFYLGRNLDYYTALEGALKLKEISYINSVAYPAGELKHGPIALIDEESTIISIITNDKIADKTLSNIEETISRGAKTLIITNIDNLKIDSEIILVPKIHPLLAGIIAIVPLQLIAYYIATYKGLDVDKPRNLAKSVTVE